MCGKTRKREIAVDAASGGRVINWWDELGVLNFEEMEEMTKCNDELCSNIGLLRADSSYCTNDFYDFTILKL